MRVGLHVLVVGAAFVVGGARAAAQPAADAPRVEAPRAEAGEAGKAGDEEVEIDEDAMSKGTLVIRAKNRTGRPFESSAVTIDAKPMGALDDGVVVLTNIPAGPHAVVIEAGGYVRFEQAVTVRDGRQQLDALLIEEPRRFPIWKWTLGTSVAMIAVGGVYGLYATSKMRDNEAAVLTVAAHKPDGSTYDYAVPVQTGDCGKSAATIADEKHSIVVNPVRFDRVCTWHGRVYLGYGLAGIGLVGAFVSAIVLMRDDGFAAPPTWSGSKPLAIAPFVGPDGGGASLTVAW